MGEMLSKALDFVFITLSGMTANGELSSLQAVFIVLFSVLVLIVFMRIKNVVGFFKDFKNARLNEYVHILKTYELNSVDHDCIKDDISRIIRYRLSGISDVARQRIIFKLLPLHREMVSPIFFKKFRTFLDFKDGYLIFNKGIAFRIECFMYGVFSMQYLVIALSLIAVSLYKGNLIYFWEHCLLYLMAVVLFLMFIAFGKMIPTPKECRLMQKILHAQNDPSPCE